MNAPDTSGSAPSDQPPEKQEEHHEQPPSYDTTSGDYAGISSVDFGSAEDLRAAKNFAEMIMDTAREGLLILDLCVKAANESFYQTFQVSPEEALGRLVYELGNGQWNLPELHQLLDDLLPENKVFNDHEVEHEFKHIGWRVMLLNARQLNEHQMILLAIEDITERRRLERELRASQERFDLLVGNAKEYAIFTMDAETRITSWNAGAQRILAWEAGEVIGERGELVFTPEDREAGVPEQEVERVMAEGSARDDRWHLRKDGSRFWSNGFMVALREEGRLRGFVKILRDETAKEAVEALQALNETLEERVEERTRQVRELASMLTMAEQERRRISQTLHDDLQQQLYGVQLKLSFAQQHAGASHEGRMREGLAEAEAWIRQSIELTRSLTVDLSPPILKSEGLADTLAWLQSQMKELHGLEVEIKAEKPFRTPEEDMRVLLFQITRELLFNVANTPARSGPRSSSATSATTSRSSWRTGERGSTWKRSRHGQPRRWASACSAYVSSWASLGGECGSSRRRERARV